MIKIHLSKLLGERRMSQAELSRKTGIRPSTVGDWYNELAERISLEHLDRICEALDCQSDEIIEYIPNKIKKTGKSLILEEHKSRRSL